jgi:hypothetical protein
MAPVTMTTQDQVSGLLPSPSPSLSLVVWITAARCVTLTFPVPGSGERVSTEKGATVTFGAAPKKLGLASNKQIQLRTALGLSLSHGLPHYQGFLQTEGLSLL